MASKAMNDAQFAVMSRLAVTGCPHLTVFNGKAILGLGRNELVVTQRTFASLVKKQWIESSPCHEYGYHATEAGRQETEASALIKLQQFIGIHGKKAGYSEVYNGVGILFAESLVRTGVLEWSHRPSFSDNDNYFFLSSYADDFLNGAKLSFLRYEDVFYNFLNPEAYASKKAEQAAEE